MIWYFLFYFSEMHCKVLSQPYTAKFWSSLVWHFQWQKWSQKTFPKDTTNYFMCIYFLVVLSFWLLSTLIYGEQKCLGPYPTKNAKMSKIRQIEEFPKLVMLLTLWMELANYRDQDQTMEVFTFVLEQCVRKNIFFFSVFMKNYHKFIFFTVFGIGSMIYTGIEIGMFFELNMDKTANCHNLFSVVRPLLQMIFVFVQMYFIFLNQKMNIYKNKLMSRIGEFFCFHDFVYIFIKISCLFTI